eukprot:scaffold130399_cov57-Phaeocystis_antarctica.AAC.1
MLLLESGLGFELGLGFGLGLGLGFGLGLGLGLGSGSGSGSGSVSGSGSGLGSGSGRIDARAQVLMARPGCKRAAHLTCSLDARRSSMLCGHGSRVYSTAVG